VARAALVGRQQAGAVIAEVVEVGAQHDGVLGSPSSTASGRARSSSSALHM